MSKPVLEKFLRAVEAVYGPLRLLKHHEARVWVPPRMKDGDRGRYLWTDAFGVINLLTLYKETTDVIYLSYARRLVESVHDVLGRHRDGIMRLPGASDAHPLRGGLRIGKVSADGEDGDGQYHHYLTLWMFALNRMAIATRNLAYNQQAIELCEAIHPHFVVERTSVRPRMYWKMSIDLSTPLVSSEGNLDPFDGYTLCKLLQLTSGDAEVLRNEAADYKKIMDAKLLSYISNDALDIGMSMWTSHWQKDEEQWAAELANHASISLRERPTDFMIMFSHLLTMLYGR